MSQRQAKEQRRLVRAVNKRLMRSGIVERVQRVREILQGAAFAQRFQEALTPEIDKSIKDLEGVRALALRLLADDFRCDVADVLLTFAWNPETRKLDISSHPAPTAVSAAVEADCRARMI